jgi:hypothetical protein
LEISGSGNVYDGTGATWTAASPSDALQIVRIYTPPSSVFVDCTLGADGYTAQFFWGNATVYGTQAITPSSSAPTGSFCPGYGILKSIQPSTYVSWAAGCYLKPTCGRPSDASELLYVRGVQLTVQENTGPTITALGANNLWYVGSAWVRGSWPISFSANDPSGVCVTAAIVNDQWIAGNTDSTPDTSQWQQCPQYGFSGQLDTTQYPNGPLKLTYVARNTPGVVSSPTETLQVDNDPVALSLSGPADAVTSAGTQYITANATAGPSGVSSIVCSIDGGPDQTYPGATARIPVAGLGSHQASCVAHNGAIDSSGVQGSSPTETQTVDIRQPTVSTVSFARIADTLRCGKVSERINVPGRWIVEKVHGHEVKVRIPAQTRKIKVVRCHPIVVTRRVRVGKHWVTRRIVELPRQDQQTTKTIDHGARTTVSGWLGTTAGNALGDQTVRIMTAPNNGSSRFTQATTATTNTSGIWTATLPAGPSRLVRASYGGTTTVAPATSEPAQLFVPSSVALSIRPALTHWGGTIKITGRLVGGYVPTGGELVVLKVGWAGGSAEIGHLYARRGGTFSSPYTFLRGSGTVTYRIWAETARESDYPFTQAASRRATVTVGP